MCNAYNHPPGCTCGWGGDGHLGGYGYSSSWHDGLLGDPRNHPVLLERLARQHRTSVSVPTTCWYCGQEIYIYSNEYGSLVLFDELGWPWPKHDCPNAPADLRGVSLRYPGRFLGRMPPHLSAWMVTILEDLEQKGRDSSYAQAVKVPVAVLSGQYDRRQASLELLRDLAQANALRRGMIVPLDCQSCGKPIWVLTPACGDAVVLEGQIGLAMKHHHCLRGVSSKVEAVRRSLPPSMSWREVEMKITDRMTRAVEAKGRTVIGHVVDREGAKVLIIKPVGGGPPVHVANEVVHPTYTLVVGMPDPHKSGHYVVRAPTFNQFMHGLPQSLPAIERLVATQAAASVGGVQSGSRGACNVAKAPAEAKVKSQAATTTDAKLPGARTIPEYPDDFRQPKVVAFFRTVTAQTLKSACVR